MRTTGDLLCSQLHELLLQLVELLLQILLVLAPKLGGLDLAGRLRQLADAVRWTQEMLHTIVSMCCKVLSV